MSWNHRVLAKEHNGHIYFEIHEVYYDGNSTPNGYTDKPITVGSDTVNGIKRTLNKIKECLKKPILCYGDNFPNEYKPTE